MDILAFHLRGKMAHFRKYYSNSSALSYWVPPRTTIVGILAGLLGMERDSYYEIFSLSQCQVGLALCSPLKKNMQKLNLLMIKSANDLNGSAEFHSQTATELIIPLDIINGFIDYKVWVHHENEAIQSRLWQLLSPDHDSYYCSHGIALALGSAEYLGWIETDRVYQGKVANSDSSIQRITSIVSVNDLIDLDFQTNECYNYVKEDLPLAFGAERSLDAKSNFIINADGTGVWGRARNLVQLDNGELIAWMH